MSGLDDESRKALVEYRLERAYATMQEAAVMTEKEFYNAAVNRLYYACYLHFVSKGLVPISIGKILSTLYEKRQSGDYDDFIYCDKEMTDDLTTQAKSFIDYIGNLVKDDSAESNN